MKHIAYLLIAVTLMLASGCVQATFQKQVQIYRDADGNITQIIETESIIRPGQTSTRLQPEHVRYSTSHPAVVSLD